MFLSLQVRLFPLSQSVNTCAVGGFHDANMAAILHDCCALVLCCLAHRLSLRICDLLALDSTLWGTEGSLVHSIAPSHSAVCLGNRDREGDTG